MSELKVALVKGQNRYQNITQVLRLLEKDLAPKIIQAQNIIIKPNFVSTNNQLAATHVEAIRATLDFLKKYTKRQIFIAENAAFTDTFEGYQNFGYTSLPKIYNVKLIDLKKEGFLPFAIYNIHGKKIEIGISKFLLESDLRISIGPAKTHDEVIVTLSLKNMIMGSLDNRPLMHQGKYMMNKNLAALAKIIPPHLAIIDGTIGMQGNGPGEGELINSGFCVASLDALGADVLATRLMGFEPENIGYLHYLGIPKKIEIMGEKIENCQTKFTPPRNYKQQLKWREKEGRLKRLIVPPAIALYLKIQKMPFYSSAWFEKIKEPVKKILGY